MATITAAGIGSGLDVNSIVSQLLDLERQPINVLDTKQGQINAQISAYGSLKSKLSDFQTAMANLSSLSSFQVFSTTSGDESLFTSSASSSAAAGTYSLEVQTLAERDKIATKAYTDSASVVGEGVLTISVGAESFDVTIDSSNNTVAGIRDAINSAADNTGVSATIVTDDNGSQLIFSTNDTGTANALKIEVADSSDGSNIDDSGLSSLAYEAGVVVFRPELSQKLDAVVKIDGFTVTRSSNTITGALDGVTIEAKAVGTSTLTVLRDDEKIKESVQKFADSYNALKNEIKNQRGGQLEADSTLLSIESQLRDILNSGSAITGSNQTYLIEAGVTIDKLGKMSVDSSKLDSILNSDFESFANLFAAKDEGFAYRLEEFASRLLESDGLIDTREQGLKERNDSIDIQKERIEARLVTIETRLRAQYSALDTLVSSLQSTGDYLTQSLSALNNK